MLDEFEIACLVKFIEKFNLLEEKAYDDNTVVDFVVWKMFYIAVAMKSIHNDD